ncbi:zinc-ribbon domain containing protein [Chloroflexota bacterium]
MSEDTNIICRQCSKEFLFTKGEQDFYQRKGLNLPSRCPECRPPKQIQRQPAICSQCKTEMDKEEAIFCTACLASVHLESELALQQKKKAVDEAQSKLRTSEAHKFDLQVSLSDVQSKLLHSEARNEELGASFCEKERLLTELDSSISEKERLILELNQEIQNVSQELEKARQFHSDLRWIHPSIDKLQERLDTLERGQNSINQRMLQLVEKMHELYSNPPGILETIKRSFHNSLSHRI